MLSEEIEYEYQLCLWVSAIKAGPKSVVISIKFGFHTCATFERYPYTHAITPDHMLQHKKVLAISLCCTKKERLSYSKP